MSIISKKLIIDPKDTEKINELKTTTEMYQEYDEFLRKTKQEQEKKKEILANRFYRIGNEMIEEIENKREEEREERNNKIKFILKNFKNNSIKKSKLNNLNNEDLESIYIKVKESKIPWLKKLINFIMNW